MEHKSYVSLETAKMLKDAGFDWAVRAHYCPKEMPNLLYDGYLSDKWNGGYYDGCYSAPTLAVAQRWLREVKKIHLNVLAWTNMPIEYSFITGRFYDGIKLCEAIGKEYVFPTYEAALDAGLQETLKTVMAKK